MAHRNFICRLLLHASVREHSRLDSLTWLGERLEVVLKIALIKSFGRYCTRAGEYATVENLFKVGRTVQVRGQRIAQLIPTARILGLHSSWKSSCLLLHVGLHADDATVVGRLLIQRAEGLPRNVHWLLGDVNQIEGVIHGGGPAWLYVCTLVLSRQPVALRSFLGRCHRLNWSKFVFGSLWPSQFARYGVSSLSFRLLRGQDSSRQDASWLLVLVVDQS